MSVGNFVPCPWQLSVWQRSLAALPPATLLELRRHKIALKCAQLIKWVYGNCMPTDWVASGTGSWEGKREAAAASASCLMYMQQTVAAHFFTQSVGDLPKWVTRLSAFLGASKTSMCKQQLAARRQRPSALPPSAYIPPLAVPFKCWQIIAMRRLLTWQAMGKICHCAKASPTLRYPAPAHAPGPFSLCCLPMKYANDQLETCSNYCQAAALRPTS